MRPLGPVAVVAALAVVALTASPAAAVDGSWEAGVLTVFASPADGDLTMRVYDDGGQVTVTSSPAMTLSSTVCHSSAPGEWWCPGGLEGVVVDGGQARADIEIYPFLYPSLDITAGVLGGSVIAAGSPAVMTGREGPDDVSITSPDLSTDLAGGDDSLAWSWDGEANRAAVDLGPGDDRFAAWPQTTGVGRARVFGGSGSDDIVVSGTRVLAVGDDGDDRFEPDAASYPSSGSIEDVSSVQVNDRVVGGAGTDTVVLANRSRTQRVRISLDGLPNDGRRGERDDYEVENVVVRYVRALVIGNPSDNRIELFGGGTARGGAGADVLRGGTVLVGGPGADVLLAGADTRRVSALDGVRDHVSCVSGHTVAYVDREDDVRGRCRVVVR